MPRPERTCGECGCPITGHQRSGYCRACMKHRCRYCAVVLPPERLTGSSPPYCKECSQRNTERQQQRLLANPKPRCHLCGVAIERWRTYAQCGPCGRQIYEDRRRLLLKQPARQCRDCAAPLAVGRLFSRCVPCQRRHERNLPSRKKPCATCGQRARLPRTVYCANCQAIHKNFRRAYHQGDPAARMLRPVQQYRRWQKEC